MAQLIFLFFSGVFAGLAFAASYCPHIGGAWLWLAFSAASFYVTAWRLHDKA